jgi:hypothetical protein
VDLELCPLNTAIRHVQDAKMPLHEAMEKESLNFNQLCTFESFYDVWNHYGYKSVFQDVIEREFSRIKGTLGYFLRGVYVKLNWFNANR